MWVFYEFRLKEDIPQLIMVLDNPVNSYVFINSAGYHEKMLKQMDMNPQRQVGLYLENPGFPSKTGTSQVFLA